MLGLSWSEISKNGVIFNEKYPWGALYEDEFVKPKFSFSYVDFEYSQEREIYIYCDNAGLTREMSEEQKTEVRLAAESWIQDIDAEGGVNWLKQREMYEKKSTQRTVLKQFVREYILSNVLNIDECQVSKVFDIQIGEEDENEELEFIKALKKGELTASFDAQANELTRISAKAHEVLSWEIQEKEAKAWLKNSEELTPFIDSLLQGREYDSKEVFVQKIVHNAQNWKSEYPFLLGRFQQKMKAIEVATDKNEVENISW